VGGERGRGCGLMRGRRHGRVFLDVAVPAWLAVRHHLPRRSEAVRTRRIYVTPTPHGTNLVPQTDRMRPSRQVSQPDFARKRLGDQTQVGGRKSSATTSRQPTSSK
jgi:hypothetical protein